MNRAAAILALVLATVLAGVTVPAHAAPSIPGSLSASGTPVPTLSWGHVPGATQYVVEISKTDDVSQRIGSSVTTVNRHYVPTQPLPWSLSSPDLYWRVAAKDSVQGDFSGWQLMSTATGHTAPSITSPANGTTFIQPGDPATLSWDPLAGTQEYEVQISPDAEFTDPAKITTAKTSSTSYVVPAPQVDTTFWFKVRARLSTTTGLAGVYTEFSEPRSYSVQALPAATRVAPATDAVIEDAVLDWSPILGARTYDLQIATDPSFGSIVHARTNITGTSYARPQTLDNDQYYWRVRAEDVAGNVPTWNSRPTWTFERAWPELPVPSYPALASDVAPATSGDVDAGVTVGDPFYYEWEPVRLASMYKIQLSTDEGFSTIVGTCYTSGTTFTPASEGVACMPGAEKTYWWRLTAMDQYASGGWSPLNYPTTSQNVFYDAKFTYSPDRVTLISPASGEEVAVPTLTWEPLAGAARYKVIWGTGTSTSSQLTAATSFTLPKLALGVYSWQVVPVSNDGREGAPLISAERTFTVVDQSAATGTVPDVIGPVGGSFARSPSMSWEPVAGATSYRVWVRVAGGSGFTMLSTSFAYPEGTDPTSANLSPGSYEWYVQALGTGSAVAPTSSNLGSFTIASPATVTGQTNVLTMAGHQAGDSCTGFACTDLRQTPILRWDPSQNTGYYKVWVTRNENLSNIIPPGELGKSTNPFTVTSTIWTPTTALQESTAGQAYYWAVQPCTYDDKCGPNPVPVNSFNKLSHAVETTSPGVVVVDGVPAGGAAIPAVSDDVTLQWRDYLETNSSASPAGSSLSTAPTQTAREYEVQVDSDHTFAAPLLDSAIVDQHSYTSFDDTYPEGNVYWRVRTFDPSGNPLPWSSTRAVNKQSPTPQLDPLVGTQGPTPTLSWQPLQFASSYQLAIYPAGSPTARLTVASNQVRWSATTAAQSLPPGGYEWAVRRKDARDRFGGWSARQPLTISESLVTLSSPSANGTVAPRDSVFSWQPVAGASDYRIILTSPVGAQTTQITKATAWAPLAKLTPGSWTWRVEARDTAGVAMGNPSARTFVVSADFAATQATRIDGSGQLDTILTGFAPVWTETPDSVTYQWLRGSTPVGDGTLSYTVTMADVGQRITLRATGAKGGHVNAVSTSNAVTGVQGAAPVAATPPSITGAGLVGETLTGNSPAWVQSGVTESYRWLVNGSSAGTAPTFIVRAADIGKQIVFEVTGKRTNYANAVVASAPVTGQPGGALQATVQPAVTGTAVVGSALTVSAGTWSQPSPSFKYQWLRNGAPIPGATGSSYRLVPGDAGTGISATVLATKTGYADGAATATAVSIPKMASTTVAALSKTRVKPGVRVKIGISVTVAGVTGPTGAIKVFDGAKKLKTLTLVSTRNGQITWKLPKLKKGKHKIKAVYIGNGTTAGSKSKITKVYVVR